MTVDEVLSRWQARLVAREPGQVRLTRGLLEQMDSYARARKGAEPAIVRQPLMVVSIAEVEAVLDGLRRPSSAG